jgi:4-hydroxybenzoate polyprenyltransferase
MDQPANLPRTDAALAIDLDGSLLRSDLLVESALLLIARRPLLLLSFPIWLFGGKAHFKQQIALRAVPDLTTLPWDERVLALAKQASGSREVVLCTATHETLAHAVAEYLGIFDHVLASDGTRNLSGQAKADALVERYGDKGFDYIGNARVDLKVWAHARRAIVANASAALTRAAAKVCVVERHLPVVGGTWKDWAKALRMHQWLKNLLVFLPLLAAHLFFDAPALLRTALGFLAFGLCASGVYLLTELLDLPADRQHPRKRERPFAAGRLPLVYGMILSPLLTLAAFLLAGILSPLFLGVLALYYLLTLAYSFRLKKKVMLDVIVLAGLYTLRIIAGAALIVTPPSFWLLAFSMFLFLSLAMLKRYTELRTLLVDGKDASRGRGYAVEDLPLVQSLGASSGYMAVLVLALYINSTASELLYRRPQVLWLLCPLLLYWISRAWMMAHRGVMRDDPVVFAVTDRTCQCLAVLAAVVAFGAI